MDPMLKERLLRCMDINDLARFGDVLLGVLESVDLRITELEHKTAEICQCTRDHLSPRISALEDGQNVLTINTDAGTCNLWAAIKDLQTRLQALEGDKEGMHY